MFTVAHQNQGSCPTFVARLGTIPQEGTVPRGRRILSVDQESAVFTVCLFFATRSAELEQRLEPGLEAYGALQNTVNVKLQVNHC